MLTSSGFSKTYICTYANIHCCCQGLRDLVSLIVNGLVRGPEDVWILGVRGRRELEEIPVVGVWLLTVGRKARQRKLGAYVSRFRAGVWLPIYGFSLRAS